MGGSEERRGGVPGDKENTVTDGARVRNVVRCTLAAGAATMLLAMPATARQGAARQPVNTQAAALQDFQLRLDQYLTLRAALIGNLKPLVETPNAAELAARQAALAAALKKARADAMP